MHDPSDRERSEPVPASERERILREVLDDQRARREARERRKARPPGGDRPFFVQVGLLVSGTLFFYLLFFSPSWIVPAAAPPITEARTDSNLRVYLSIVARQIDAYRDREGQLPATVADLPGVRQGTEYMTTSQGYRIGYSHGEVEVTYESSQDLTEFAGGATARVLGTPTTEASPQGET